MPLYEAVRPFYGDEGSVSRGQILDIDEDRAKALRHLVRPAASAPASEPVVTKVADEPLNKMEVAPPNKAKRGRPRAKPAPATGVDDAPPFDLPVEE